MTRALVFPGQGSQQVGMGAELAAAFSDARDVFSEVDDALGRHLFRVMREGPEADLTLTENAQPALMAVGMAVVRVLERQGGRRVADLASHVAGHSLGEYTALCAAGAIGLADTARLLRRRGEAMQQAVPVGEGAMAAILGLELDAVAEVAQAAAGDGVCAAANDNAPGQVVVSGTAAAVDRAIALATEKGAKRAIPLAVSAPFHCALMAPAADAMAEALASTRIMPPTVPVVANVTAEPVSDPEQIRELLVRQVTATVRWRESVAAMAAAGVDAQVECGVGKVLTGLARRIVPGIAATALATPADIEAFLAQA